MTNCVPVVPIFVIVVMLDTSRRGEKMPLTSLSAAKVVAAVLLRQILVIASNSRLLKAINDYQINFKNGSNCDLIPAISLSVYLVENSR